MTDVHQSAERLMLKQQVEGVSDAEREWLEQHIDGCPECARKAGSTRDTLRNLRAVSIPMPPQLAARAQVRVYLRAQEVRRHEHAWILWIVSAISWALGLASAPYVWHLFRWIGGHAALPDAVWKTGFVFWWAFPALLTVTALLIERWRTEKGSEDDVRL